MPNALLLPKQQGLLPEGDAGQVLWPAVFGASLEAKKQSFAFLLNFCKRWQSLSRCEQACVLHCWSAQGETSPVWCPPATPPALCLPGERSSAPAPERGVLMPSDRVALTASPLGWERRWCLASSSPESCHSLWCGDAQPPTAPWLLGEEFILAGLELGLKLLPPWRSCQV